MHDLDEVVQSQLLLSALKITTAILGPGGHFVAKIFKGENTGLLLAQFRLFFDSVEIYKPPSSRASSAEHFIICRAYCCPPGFSSSLLEPYCNAQREGATIDQAMKSLPDSCAHLVPFVARGDLSSYDYATMR